MPIESYEILDELGRGAMGRVLRARHKPTGVMRAIKIMDCAPDPESVARFRREAESLARAAGDGAVAIHEAGVEGRRLFFVMDLAAGGSLRGKLAGAGGRLAWREAVELVAGLAAALGRCHAKGLVHRDLKPENVLLDEEGRPRLADFGCVRDLGATTLTESGTVLGTPAYMAPEQLRGERVDARADVFSLGAVLYELVTGSRPFSGRSIFQLHEQAAAGRFEAASKLSEAPAALDEVLTHALAPDPARRFADGAALEAAMRRVLSGAKGGAAPAPRTHARAVAAGLAVVVVVTVLSAVALRAASRRSADSAAASSSGRPPATDEAASSPVSLAAIAQKVRGDEAGAEALARDALARGFEGVLADAEAARAALPGSAAVATLYVRAAFALAPELQLDRCPTSVVLDADGARDLEDALQTSRSLARDMTQLYACTAGSPELPSTSAAVRKRAARLAGLFARLGSTSPAAARPLAAVAKEQLYLACRSAEDLIAITSVVRGELEKLRGGAAFLDAWCWAAVGPRAGCSADNHHELRTVASRAEEVAQIDSLLAAAVYMAVLEHRTDACELVRVEHDGWRFRSLELELASTEPPSRLAPVIERTLVEISGHNRVSGGSAEEAELARRRLVLVEAARTRLPPSSAVIGSGAPMCLLRLKLAANDLAGLETLSDDPALLACIDACRAADEGRFEAADRLLERAKQPYGTALVLFIEEARAFVNRRRSSGRPWGAPR